MREVRHTKDFQSQRFQAASDRQRSHRVSGLALAGCRGNAKMGNRRAADEGSDGDSSIACQLFSCTASKLLCAEHLTVPIPLADHEFFLMER